MHQTNQDKYTIGSNRDASAVTKISSLNADFEHIERLDTVESTRFEAIKRTSTKFHRHWRRFWCCYMLAAVIFLAIFLPIFFLIIIPAIAQRIVDTTNLPVYSAQILDPTPDSVTFSLQTSLAIPAGLQVHIDALSLVLFNRDVSPIKPFIRVPLSAYDLKGTTSITVTQNHTHILDTPQLVTALGRAVYQKRFTLSAKGSTTGHIGALKAPLKLNKDVELDGLDKLRGFSIESARLIIPEEDGVNLEGVANLPNHSVVTFALGNVTLNLKSEDLILGHATIYDVLLKPGNNTVSLKGRIDIQTVIENFATILGAQEDAIVDGNIRLSASGNSTIYNGQHISYYEEILNGLTLTAEFPIIKALLNTVEGMGGDFDITSALQQVSNADIRSVSGQ